MAKAWRELWPPRDLAEVWVTERVQRGETVPREARTLIGEVELTDALFSP
jgi:hypothetical protein